jgi:hypothetical protein
LLLSRLLVVDQFSEHKMQMIEENFNYGILVLEFVVLSYVIVLAQQTVN